MILPRLDCQICDLDRFRNRDLCFVDGFDAEMFDFGGFDVEYDCGRFRCGYIYI